MRYSIVVILNITFLLYLLHTITYFDQVCSGKTQHVEVYDLTFKGDEKTYENMVKHFYTFHDPTTLNQQGNDRGTQYASVIFYHDDKQVSTVECIVERCFDQPSLHL